MHQKSSKIRSLRQDKKSKPKHLKTTTKRPLSTLRAPHSRVQLHFSQSATPTPQYHSTFSSTSSAFRSTLASFATKRVTKASQALESDQDVETMVTKPAATKRVTKKAVAQSQNPSLPLPSTMTLQLQITDPEVIAFLHEASIIDHIDLSKQNEHQQELATNALKIGVLALKSAQSKVDVHTIHTEIDRMMSLLQTNLAQHNQTVNDSVQSKLKEYFDPSSGRFEERMKRLLHKDDGELTNLVKLQIIKTSSTLSENLTPLIGPGSKLLTLLDPDNKAGLVSLVQWAVGEANKSILAEFSLDNKHSSLRRLIAELREVSAESTTTNTQYLKELSLDNPQSALNRLIKSIETGQKEQLKQMSLDNTSSPISRLKLDIVEILSKQQQQLNNMEQMCVKEFSTLNATRSVYDRLSKRTTLHGLDFEARLFSFVQTLMSGVNPIDASGESGALVGSYSSSDHIVAAVGSHTGAIRNCKVGDILITMGPEHISSGAKIVIEAKADSSYNIAKALDEIQIAKKNRNADVGIFVFAKQSTQNNNPDSPNTFAPSIENLKRYGNDVVVVWDPEDPTTNIYLDAALSISKALLIRKQQSLKQTNNTLHELDTNIATMNSIVVDLEKEMVLYDDIRKFAETIHSSTEKMLHRLKNSGGRVISNIEKLEQHIKTAKQLSGVLHANEAQSGTDANETQH